MNCAYLTAKQVHFSVVLSCHTWKFKYEPVVGQWIEWRNRPPTPQFQIHHYPVTHHETLPRSPSQALFGLVLLENRLSAWISGELQCGLPSTLSRISDHVSKFQQCWVGFRYPALVIWFLLHQGQDKITKSHSALLRFLKRDLISDKVL